MAPDSDIAELFPQHPDCDEFSSPKLPRIANLRNVAKRLKFLEIADRINAPSEQPENTDNSDIE